MHLQVTDVQIVPIRPNKGLVAFASVTLNDALYLGSIAVYARLDGSGYRVTYPTKQSGRNSNALFHPVTPELSRIIELAIISKMKQLSDT